MLISEMEAVLKSLDGRIEQLDHRVEKLDHRVEQLDHRVEKLDHRVGRIEQILPTLATKADLASFATKAELRAEIRAESRGVKVLIEDARSDTRLLAEHLSTLMDQMGEALRRLDRIERR